MTTGVTGRTELWRAGAVLIKDRPWFQGFDGPPAIVRHLFGYGPDTFYYVYPLEASPANNAVSYENAHNLWENAAVETGVIGALFLLLSAAVPGLGGAYLTLTRWRAWPMAYRMLAVALVASIAGRTVEQMSGWSHISDAVIAWPMIGALIALPGVAAGRSPSSLPAASRARTPWKAACLLIAGALIVTTGVVTVVHTWSNVVGQFEGAASANAGSTAGGCN